MADQLGKSTATITNRSNGSYVDSFNTNSVERHTYRAPLTSGAYIEYPDGSRFRKSTNHEASSFIMHRGNSELTDFNASAINKWRSTTTPGGFMWTNKINDMWINSGPGAATLIPNLNRGPSIDSMERNEAITKALNKIADQKANIGENLLTLRQTAKLFGNPVRGLVDGLRRIRKDRDVRPYLARSYSDLVRMGVPTWLSQKYLAYVFGLKPFMEDIFGIQELARQQSDRPLLLNARAKATREYQAKSVKSDDTSNRRRYEISAISGRGRTSVSLWARIDPDYSGTRMLNQLGLTNPAALVWELVPYSFVVDWLLPVGPVLQALTAPAGLLFVDGSISKRTSASFSVSDRRYRSTETYLSVSPAYSRFSYEGYLRNIISGWPRPGLWIDYDPLRLSADGSDRVFKALALAIVSLR